MEFFRQRRWIVGVLGLIAVAAIGAAASVAAAPGDPNQVTEGGELIDQATISVEQAIAAARTVASGSVREVEVERGTLIYEVELGAIEVIVDAKTGAVLGTEIDDDGGMGDDHDSADDDSRDHDD